MVAENQFEVAVLSSLEIIHQETAKENPDDPLIPREKLEKRAGQILDAFYDRHIAGLLKNDKKQGKTVKRTAPRNSKIIRDMYTKRLFSFLANLWSNKALRKEVLAPSFDPATLVEKTSREYAPQVWQELEAQVRSEQELKIAKREKGLYRCKARGCGSEFTVHQQMQLAGADEPMTTLVQCLDCNTVSRY